MNLDVRLMRHLLIAFLFSVSVHGFGQTQEAIDWSPIEMTPHYRQYDLDYNIPYLDTIERQQYRVELRNGQFVNSQGELISNIVAAIFVVDRNGEMYVYIPSSGENKPLSKAKKPTNHSSFVAGNSVLMAGTVRFEDGKLVYLDNNSGHYSPPSHMLEFYLRYLEKIGVPIEEVEYRFHDLAQTIRPQDRAHIARKSADVADASVNSSAQCGRLIGLWRRFLGTN